MKQIQRFTPHLVQSPFGFSRAVMTHCDDGGYVDIQSHWEEMRRLQSEIDALKSVQKSKILDGLHPLAAKGAEAILESILESINSSDEFQKLVNPESVKAGDTHFGFFTGGPVTFLNEALIKDSTINCSTSKLAVDHALSMKTDPAGVIRVVITDAAAKDASPLVKSIMERFDRHDRKRALCVGSPNPEVFTVGESYPLEAFSLSVIRIAGDNLVSDLNDEDHWIGHRYKGHKVYSVQLFEGAAFFEVK